VTLTRSEVERLRDEAETRKLAAHTQMNTTRDARAWDSYRKDGIYFESVAALASSWLAQQRVAEAARCVLESDELIIDVNRVGAVDELREALAALDSQEKAE
jgi:hypothetical protein